MALPNQINATVPAGSDLPSTIDNRIRSLAGAVEDILGIPDQTNSTATAMAVSPSGTAYVRFANVAATPNTDGFLQRNGTGLIFYDGVSANILDTNQNTATLYNKTMVSPNVLGSLTITADARSGTPSTTGSWVSVSGNVFTDNATAAAATANSYAAHSFQRPIIAASNSSAVTDATTLYIQNSPQAGTNKTITNAWAVWVDDGRARFDGQLAGAGIPIVNEYRISLTSNTPITTTDVTNATTVYVTPYGGNHITLYDGTIWQNYQPGEMSIAVAATANVNFDLFCQPVSGTPTLVAVTWSNDTSRTTALTTQDGVYVLSGTLSRRYLGTFRCGPVSGQVFDSAARRHCWNYYNRVDRHMVTSEVLNSWTYDTDTWRQMNGSTANQLDLVVGVAEDSVEAEVNVTSTHSTDADHGPGIGIDSTTTDSSITRAGNSNNTGGVTQYHQANYRGILAAGRHTIAALERADTGTATWFGDNGAEYLQAGIHGKIRG